MLPIIGNRKGKLLRALCGTVKKLAATGSALKQMKKKNGSPFLCGADADLVVKGCQGLVLDGNAISANRGLVSPRRTGTLHCAPGLAKHSRIDRWCK